MGAAVESLPARATGLRSSALRRPLSLQGRGCRLWVEPDASLRSFYSLQERRALFGFEQLSFFKVQAGVVVRAQRPDWGVRVTPRSVQFGGRMFDSVEVVQSLDLHRGRSFGYLRRVRLRNAGQAPIRIRVLSLHDPTAAHSDTSGSWGSLGVNAFNRESHVAMDEVSDPPSARVLGSSPSPSRYYMTTSASRALEVVSSGELPEGTAGMSGQVMVAGSHQFELSGGESREVAYASIYSPGKLEDALAEFGRIQSGEKPAARSLPLLACSERAVTEAAEWALTSMEAGAYSVDALDMYEALPGLSRVDPQLAQKVIGQARSALRKDGYLGHSLDPSKQGPLETALFLRGLAIHLLSSQDHRLARAHYPTVKKVAVSLLASSKDFAVVTDPGLPQGWRRHIGSGYPTAEVPEVSLAVAEALFAAAQVSRMLSKSDDAGKFRERSEMITDRARKKLVDERGFLALCRDSSGRVRSDDAVDAAVAAYRHRSMGAAEQAAAHRLLERDFDTPYGPRCVPTTNQVYFNSAYGWGQLGGVWTRATLAHALVCYRVGLAGMGSLALGKVGRLVADDGVRLGGSPGEFPLWVDADARAVHGEEGDPVAAARFMEVLLDGELGFASGADGVSLSPASSSGLGWVMASDFWAGEPFAVFVGRSGGEPHLFYAGGRLGSKSGGKFAKFERIDVPVKGVYGLSLHSPGQVICLGNSTTSPVRFVLSFPPRAADLSRRLSTPLEIYDPSKKIWNKSESLRVGPTMSFDAALGPNEWKVWRISSA